MISRSKKSGFSAVELLITLFVAAVFLIAGYQLYDYVTNDGGTAKTKAKAADVADEYLSKYKANVASTCVPQTILNNEPITVDDLYNATISVAVSCPYASMTTVSKVSVSLTYGDPQETVNLSTYSKPTVNCPTGFIVVPGSVTYGTTSFCVMKYEAKNVNGTAVSQASGNPWVNITQQDSALVSQKADATSAILTDGDITSDKFYFGSSSGPNSVTIDLGSVKTINAVRVWHYYAGSRTYYGTETEVSADGVNWETVFNSAESGDTAETAAGIIHTFMPRQARYVRDWTTGSYDGHSHWVEIKVYSPVGGAMAAAATACNGCHLITEAEWMTIAQNVASVASNWSSGVVGTGNIYRGHTDNSPANSLVASSSDSDGYSGTSNSSSSGPEQKRTLTLTNGEVIWDFAGNVWEWTAGQVASGKPGITGETSLSWKEYTAVTATGSSLATSIMPSGLGLTGSSNWNSTYGIGTLYSNAGDLGLCGFIRGGAWDVGTTNAGILALGVNNWPGNVYSSLGFRAAK